MSDAVVAQETPIKVDLEEGQKYAWCSCGLSDGQPFCNGSHKEAGEFKPNVFVAETSESRALCACKQTKNAPFCDGSHNTL
jgi:CDGSH-type Zn-finger protein